MPESDSQIESDTSTSDGGQVKTTINGNSTWRIFLTATVLASLITSGSNLVISFRELSATEKLAKLSSEMETLYPVLNKLQEEADLIRRVNPSLNMAFERPFEIRRWVPARGDGSERTSWYISVDVDRIGSATEYIVRLRELHNQNTLAYHRIKHLLPDSTKAELLRTRITDEEVVPFNPEYIGQCLSQLITVPGSVNCIFVNKKQLLTGRPLESNGSKNPLYASYETDSGVFDKILAMEEFPRNLVASLDGRISELQSQVTSLLK